jgi:hypothetical protein
MNTCKTCRFWDGTCDRIEIREKPVQALNDNDAVMEYGVADDWNLNIRLKCGPNFGCVKHEIKN